MAAVSGPATAARAGLFERCAQRAGALLSALRGDDAALPDLTPNGVFDGWDALFYHALLRRERPRRVLEVGAGHSTRISLRALQLNGAGEVLAVDPWPRAPLEDCGPLVLLPRPVEEMPLSCIDELRPGDVLFIDSSHDRAEAVYHVEVLLPRLPAGVWIHHHDIFWPDAARYEEESVVLDFYARRAASYEVLWGVSHLLHRHRDILLSKLPHPEAATWSGSSLWCVKTS